MSSVQSAYKCYSRFSFWVSNALVRWWNVGYNPWIISHCSKIWKIQCRYYWHQTYCQLFSNYEKKSEYFNVILLQRFVGQRMFQTVSDTILENCMIKYHMMKKCGFLTVMLILHQHFGLKDTYCCCWDLLLDKFWSLANSWSVFDSMSNKAFLDTSYALAHLLATAFKPILNVSNRNSEWTFEVPVQNVPQQPNICDCALHVAGRLCFCIFGIEYAVSTKPKWG